MLLLSSVVGRGASTEKMIQPWNATSTNFNEGAPWGAISGAGMSSSGSRLTDTHNNGGSAGEGWFTDWQKAAIHPGTTQIVFNLGGKFNLTKMRLWNWGMDGGASGVKTCDIALSRDGIAWTPVTATPAEFASAPINPVAAQDITLTGVNDWAQYVRLDQCDRFGGGGLPRAGLAEVRFFGTGAGTVPIQNFDFCVDASDWTTVGGAHQVSGFRDLSGGVHFGGFVDFRNPGSGLSQDLGDEVQAGTYTLSYYVADRGDVGWMNYRAELVAVNGTNETVIISKDSASYADMRPPLATQDASGSLAPGTWQQVVLTGTALHRLDGQILRLRFAGTSDSGEYHRYPDCAFHLDTVQLTFVPAIGGTVLVLK